MLIMFGFIRTTGDYLYADTELWNDFIKITKQAAEFLLIMAMAAVGYNTSFINFKKLGIKPFFIGLSAALATSISSTIIIFIIINV